MDRGTSTEQARLREAREGTAPWRKWGPYLSERQWGTVREDYSESGTAWDYFPHDHARSRAYRWGEDGLAGLCDDRQRLCFALALWNGADPILKERAFGLTNGEGNHGEDVKEYYFYLDATPTHSYGKYLYKYPQQAFPYDELVRVNKARTRQDREYELIDTGIFDGNRYFDVFAEHAKASAEDILILLTVHNRGPEPASLHLLPTLWFRNLWADRPDVEKPSLSADGSAIAASHPELGALRLECEGSPPLLFTNNETNNRRLFGSENPSRFVKDGINDFLLHGQADAINPAATGTKAAAHYRLEIAAGASASVRLRLRPAAATGRVFGTGFDKIVASRRAEADAFYHGLTPAHLDDDERCIFRQALAGMLWGKQHYHYDVARWLEQHHASPFAGEPQRAVRNAEWFHMANDHVISMPDKWEYPWYATWDLGFQCLALVLVDPDFAKQQLELMLMDDYIHPNGHRMLDEEEFLGPFGIRSLSRFHRDHPFRFQVGERVYTVGYHPAESVSGSFGGNSNWRGPVWMPINMLIVRALLNLHRYYGDGFKVECPTGSGQLLTLLEIAEEIGRRICAIFRRGLDGTRPLYGGAETFQTDPHWRDLILFHEYFHGDNGAGIGASHQTGWTGGVALLSMLTGAAGAMAREGDSDRNLFFTMFGGLSSH